MLSTYVIENALIRLCLEDTAFDIIIMHETDCKRYRESVLVIGGALDQTIKEEFSRLGDDGIPSFETSEECSHPYFQRGVFSVKVPQLTDIDDSMLLDVYRRYVRIHFHPSQMNIFFLQSVKCRNHAEVITVEFSFLYSCAAQFKLNPIYTVRRLYHTDYNYPVEENKNKR